MEVWYLIPLYWSVADPNLNTLCVCHSHASPLSKKSKKFVWSEKRKKHIWTRVPSCSFAFLSPTIPFLEIWCPFYSIIYYYNLLFCFVIQENISLTHYSHANVWSCFPLLGNVFIKLILWAGHFDAISNQTVGTYWSAHSFLELAILAYL